MNYSYSDYKKLKDLEVNAYLTMQEFIRTKDKSVQDVIIASETFGKFRDELQNKKPFKPKTKIDTSTPIEKFENRNNLSKLDNNNDNNNDDNEISPKLEIRNLRLLGVAIVLSIVVGCYVLKDHKLDQTGSKYDYIKYGVL